MRNSWKAIRVGNELKVRNKKLESELTDMYNEHRKLENIITELHTQISDEKSLNKVLSEKYRDINIENQNLKNEVAELENCVKDANSNMFIRIEENEKLKRSLARAEKDKGIYAKMSISLSEKVDELQETVDKSFIDKLLGDRCMYGAIIAVLLSTSLMLFRIQ